MSSSVLLSKAEGSLQRLTTIVSQFQEMVPRQMHLHPQNVQLLEKTFKQCGDMLELFGQWGAAVPEIVPVADKMQSQLDLLKAVQVRACVHACGESMHMRGRLTRALLRRCPLLAKCLPPYCPRLCNPLQKQ